MKRFDCRKVIEEDLKKIGLWRDKKDNKRKRSKSKILSDSIKKDSIK